MESIWAFFRGGIREDYDFVAISPQVDTQGSKMLSTNQLSTHESSTCPTSRSTVSRISPLGMIVLVWAAGIVVLLALQALGFGVGLRVRPLAEDRYLIRLMANYHWLEVPRQFWATVESRNPLVPWWYQAFSPLIFFRPEGLYLLRKLVDLFLAASVYLLIDKISRGRLPKFAFACGVLVLFWNFSGYVEQILWLTLLSLGLSILSVYFYCRYLDSDRTTADDVVVSLLLFFVALATYSIQCGVPIAVFLLGLFRRQETTEGRRWSLAVRRAIKDTLFYAVLFVLFIQIWITTSTPMADYFHPDLFLKQFVDSVANFVWHRDTSYLVDSLNRHWPLRSVLASFGVSAILFYCLFVVFARKAATRPGEGSSALYLVLVLAVFGALVVPTLLLESTTAIWSPGTRSRMVQQGFQPIVYLSIFFLLTECLAQRMGQGVEYVRNAGIALLCAFAVVIGLEYNRIASEQTIFERKLETGLKKILPH